MGRKSHPNKEIEHALQHAEDNGWRITPSKGHPFCKIFCPYNNAECRCGLFCIASVWSTPSNPVSHAREIKRIVDNCAMHKQKQQQQNAAPAASAAPEDGDDNGI